MQHFKTKIIEWPFFFFLLLNSRIRKVINDSCLSMYLNAARQPDWFLFYKL